MSDITVLLQKWFSNRGIFLAKGQFDHSYTFWTLYILVFIPVANLMHHPLFDATGWTLSFQTPKMCILWLIGSYNKINFPQSWPHQDLLSRNVLGLAVRMFPPQRWYHLIFQVLQSKLVGNLLRNFLKVSIGRQTYQKQTIWCRMTGRLILIFSLCH